MGTIFVNVDAVHIFGINIAAYMRAFVYHQTPLSTTGKDVRSSGTEKSSTND
jgi:hypothetical protein